MADPTAPKAPQFQPLPSLEITETTAELIATLPFADVNHDRTVSNDETVNFMIDRLSMPQKRILIDLCNH